MINSLFTQAKPPPLTAFCMQLSKSENLLKAAHSMAISPSSGRDKRADVLLLVIMSAEGHFFETFRWDKHQMWEGSRKYLRDTTPDLITAEAIVWITFLLGQLRLADKKKDPEMFERVGNSTIYAASVFSLGFIKSETNFDFTARANESRKLYSQSKKNNTLVEAFASVLLRSVGCRTLADPPKTITGLLPPSEWVPINMVVSVFFSTIPVGIYDTFKNMLREWSDFFPHDDDEYDEDDVDDDNRAEALVKQALKMNWKIDVEVQKDGDPFEWIRKSVRFVRRDEEAVVWNSDATVTLVRAHAPPTFESFIDLENWLAKNPKNKDGEDTNEEMILYLREIEKYIIRMGHFDKLLETRATDELFFRTCFELHKAGYVAGEDATIVAALTLDALMHYHKSRQASLSFLARYLEDFQSKTPHS